jgi:hypothetical protein
MGRGGREVGGKGEGPKVFFIYVGGLTWKRNAFPIFLVIRLASCAQSEREEEKERDGEKEKIQGKEG